MIFKPDEFPDLKYIEFHLELIAAPSIRKSEPDLVMTKIPGFVSVT